MYDAFAVRGIEGIRDLDGKGENLLDLHGTTADPVLERDAIQILHGDERLTVSLVNFVNGTDVGGD